MSEAKPATPEQQNQAQQFIEQAKQQAMQEIQQNMQIEIQMRGNSLSLAVNANEPGTDPAIIAKTAEVFLKFLKQGAA
jgi:rRNA processing protein Krr1/Pno1